MGTNHSEKPSWAIPKTHRYSVVVAHYMCCGVLYHTVTNIIQDSSRKIKRKVTNYDYLRMEDSI